jgi:predicted secreted acid phosphatase
MSSYCARQSGPSNGRVQAHALTGRRWVWLLAVFASASIAACVSSVPHAAKSSPGNLGELKTALIEYQRSGQYLQEIEAVDSQAKAYLASRAAHVSKPALVLDIDETSLSNWREIMANDFGYIPGGKCDDLPKGPCGVHEWELKGEADAIAPTLDLFRSATAANVAVFFITGRDESERRATESNLKAAGFIGWKRVILRPAGSKTPSAADYKAPERGKIEAEGYSIVANVGDQPSDLAGGHAERTFLLPNPFYRIP